MAGDGRLADKGVADAVQRPNHATIFGGIAERFAELRDERRKARLGDMHAGPERGVQLRMRYRVWLVPDEDQQQLERFRREMDQSTPFPSDQAPSDVDADRTHGSLVSCRSDALSCVPARRSGLEPLLPGVRSSRRRVANTDADRLLPIDAPSSDALDGAQFIPGTMLADRYRIVGLLGRGGMGEVYRAEDLKLGQPVALKFLPAAVTHRADRLARFHQEVRLARQVSHPNVCRVHDIGETGGQHFLSMEYIDGEDLASLLRRIGRLPSDKALEIARQLCAGLAAAHDKKVLHRDLKPANVLIDGRGRAHLADFGLANLTDERRDPPEIAGTPGYMAPEQLAGRAVTTRTDVYALGLVLYEMFTGKRALTADGARSRRPRAGRRAADQPVDAHP